MTAYYNDNDKNVSAWLRELIRRGLIAPGDVDERSITDVKPEDLKGYTQCHFFAGICGWSYALRLAGWPDDRPVWTGSPPCQPFSTAGKKRGYEDERHLAPVWLDLIRECRPSVIFGEQVASAASNTKHHWLDDLQDALEAENYAAGAIVLPACSVGAPHIRQRLWFVAERVGDTNYQGFQGRKILSEREDRQSPWASSVACRMADTDSTGPQPGGKTTSTARYRSATDPARGADRHESTDASDSPWQAADWLFCRDEKWRPVETGTFPLADGIPARVGRLCGYGNAIVPQVAAEVIKAYMES